MCLDATRGALRRSHGLSEGHIAHAPRPTKRTRHRRCRYISTAKSRLIGKLTGQIDWKPTKAPNQAGPLSHVRQALRNVHLQRKVVHCFALPDRHLHLRLLGGWYGASVCCEAAQGFHAPAWPALRAGMAVPPSAAAEFPPTCTPRLFRLHP